ncbi:MAG: phospholipase/carboxylesterase [Bacteroidetes bacterium]|nr:phospholipase/carboxylesterase [Bacteroidota bacterium]
MLKKNIIIPKTARYFLSAEPSGNIEEIWFVCHGYAQLANYFIKNFEALNTGKALVVAPEALNRFYWNGFSGKVVASWMTKEDREDEIRDYVAYLDAVYQEVLSQLENKNVKITVLGFSQGTATVCRWLANGRSHADNMVLWAGAFPADMDLQLNKAVFNEMRTVLVTGDQDEFIKEEQVKEHEQLLKENGISHEVLRFSGRHEIREETLLELASRLRGA